MSKQRFEDYFDIDPSTGELIAKQDVPKGSTLVKEEDQPNPYPQSAFSTSYTSNLTETAFDEMLHILENAPHTIPSPAGPDTIDDAEEIDLSGPMDRTFNMRLNSVLKDNKFDRWQRGRTRGSLDMKALHKVPTGAISLFKKKEARKNKHYNITILVDTSGSMWDWYGDEDEDGDEAYLRIDKALETTKLLVQAFNGADQDVSVIGYSDMFQEHIFKDERLDGPEIEKRLNQMRSIGQGGTVDYPALQYAYSRFKGRGNNLLFVLCDGGIGGRAGPSTVKQWYKRLEQGGRTFGISKGTTPPMSEQEFTEAALKNTAEEAHHLIAGNSHVETIVVGIDMWGGSLDDYAPRPLYTTSANLKRDLIKEIRGRVLRG